MICPRHRLISSLGILQFMSSKMGGLLSNNLAVASIVFAVLTVLFIVFGALKFNLWVEFALLVVMMMVGFFGILPHAFEEMK